MAQLVLSTSNIMGGGPHAIKHATVQKSNTEFTSALRGNFAVAQRAAQHHPTDLQNTLDGATNGRPELQNAYHSWTKKEGDILFVPKVDFEKPGLAEERSSYEVTVKLFFLPHKPASCRCAQTRRAIDLVLKELHISSVDLLIVSYPGITFSADDEEGDFSDPEGGEPKSEPELDAEDLDLMIETWGCLEQLHDEGVIGRLGVAEFGTERLTKFLSKVRVKPTVNQINVRDCCVVPRPLILYAKQQGVELLTHNDCENILPTGTVRDLLGQGPKGAGILAGKISPDQGLQGEIESQWVVKYTAVVRDRGVIENKGYFALAELK